MSMPTFNQAEALPAKQMLRSAVFIDKNGTLIEEVPNNVSPEALRFMPHAFEAIKKLSNHGHAIVVVTSEPGLGLGLFNRSALSSFEHAMITRIRSETGVEVAGFYTCPHKQALAASLRVYAACLRQGCCVRPPFRCAWTCSARG